MKIRQREQAKLTATPNPIPSGSTIGSTTIAWDTGTGRIGRVSVTEIGGRERLFARGAKGVQEAHNIASGSQYEFRLYDDQDHGAKLASLTVSHEPISWETVVTGLLAFAQREADWDGVADLIGIAISRFYLPPHRPRFFHLWESWGFHVTPIHYYYPIPDTRQLPDQLWSKTSGMAGIDMNVKVQLDLLRRCFSEFRNEYDQFPLEPTGREYEFYFNNSWFSGTDALVLYCMIRHFRPHLVLEIGSGFSTRVSLQAALKNADTQIVCVEPFPDDPVRHDVLRGGGHDLMTFIQERVEDVEVGLFEQLRSGDILFIDSSHISRIGSDVNRLVLEVLPRLKPGVIVHFHDIFLPWEYPREWVVDKMRFFNEQYMLQAFLACNQHFSVLMANHYLGRAFPGEMRVAFPQSPWWGGESFWIRRNPE